MSDSKKDLTRIEDLGEYLHQLDDEEDYLPEIPDESEPPTFMEETLISEDSFSTSDDSSPHFESDVNDFSSNDTFESTENFESSSFETDENSDFSTHSTFDSGDDFNGQDFSTTEVSFDSGSDISESTSSFESADEFSLNSEEDTQGFSIQEDVQETSDDTELFSQDFSLSQEPTPTATLRPVDIIEPESDDSFTPTLTAPLEKTPLPQTGPATPYILPENFEDLKKFAENSSFTGMASEGNPSFSVLLKEIRFLEDAQDILTLLKELGLAMDEDEVLINRLSRGEFLIPRISEFAATLLAHKLRRFDIDILVGPSDEIHPPKHAEVPEVGLVSKHNLYQNQAHHFQFDEVNLDISQIIVSATPTLDGYQVLKYVGVASEHKMLDGHLVEDESSLEISSHYHELAQKLKAHALKSHANAVVGLNYQLTPLPSNFGTSSTRYRLTCTGNLVWINRI